jgi:pyridoxamine 5'-phosphate oxidase
MLPSEGKMEISSLRESYRRGGLTEKEADGDPFRQFGLWFQDAMDAGLREPNAMTLATADLTGAPSARVVLLKSFDAQGFVFFTNYGSRKGRELASNPACSLVFFWNELERQVRVVGQAEKILEAESEAYFQSRPRESQLGAWVSEQSAEISGREELTARLAELEQRFAQVDPLPKPEHWGGYLVRPVAIEFWQGRVGRLHDRLLYRQQVSGWSRVRLAP